MKNLAKSREETMQSVIYMAEIINYMNIVSAARADLFIAERPAPVYV